MDNQQPNFLIIVRRRFNKYNADFLFVRKMVYSTPAILIALKYYESRGI